jgi:predicted helicase
MKSSDLERIRSIKTFPSLVKYLRDELDWPIDSDNVDDVMFDYEPEELGLDAKTAVNIKEIKQLRPLTTKQPWGIFFINFEPKYLPVVVLRRVLRALVIKKRQSANKSHQAAWNLHDLLFISSYGESAGRSISFAHFTESEETGDLPSLRVLGWDDQDTVLHLDHAHTTLKEKLRWPEEEVNLDTWRTTWSSAFTVGYRQVITNSKELAARMAGLATQIRKRANAVLAIESEHGPFRKLHEAFKESLVHDLSEDDFADMYAQTITYGLLTAKFSRPAGLVADNLVDMIPPTNPFLKDLLATFLSIGGRKGKIDFDELGINEVVELLRNTDTEAIKRDFGNLNPDEDPVIRFYEDFLKQYDARKRMQRGVFFTPVPVVSFIVRSVHEILQKEFGLDDGLADTTTWGEFIQREKVHNPKSTMRIPDGVSPDEPFVLILDIAAGTGTFMVMVIEVVFQTMMAKWRKQGKMELEIPGLWDEYVPKHLLPRLYGYELMMAPYAIAHMKIGLKLSETGYKFRSNERLHLYLTNTLEPPHDISGQLELMAPALAHEAKAVNQVKVTKRFTVIVGNPPYAGVSSNLTPAVRMIIEPYRFINGERIKEKGALQFEKNLNDDYVKFLRYAEIKIEECVGVVGMITNNGYLESATLRGLRAHLLSIFDKIDIVDLHGDADKRDTAADGSSDENVFDIKHGVTIAFFHRTSHGEKEALAKITRRDLKGVRDFKYKWLDDNCLSASEGNQYSPRPRKYLFRTEDESVASEYDTGSSVIEMLSVNSTGFESGRDEILTGFAKGELRTKLKKFTEGSLAEIKEEFSVGEGWGKKLLSVRSTIIHDPAFSERFRQFVFTPFDWRWCFYRKDLLKTNSFSAGKHLCYGKNISLVVMRQVSIDAGFSHAFVSRDIPNNRCFYSTKGKVSYFPIHLFAGEADLVRASGDFVGSNFTLSLVNLLHDRWKVKYDPRGIGDPGTSIGPENILAYIYAILYSPSYRKRYDQFLRVDFPRVPFTTNTQLFHSLAKSGSELIALHLMESPKLEKHITRVIGKELEVEKVSYSNNTIWIDKAQTSGFKGVPENVWEFHIGGYQVCEKWLKDRKGRTLTKEDIKHYHRIVVALNETIRLMAEIDKVIDEHGGWPIK